MGTNGRWWEYYVPGEDACFVAFTTPTSSRYIPKFVMIATFYDARHANDSYESCMISVSHPFGTSVIQWDVEWSLQIDSVYQEAHRCTDGDTFL
jgi:hypothetical protein